MTTEAEDKKNDDQHLPGLQALCGQIGGIIAGRAAAEVDGDALPDSGSFVVLPSWVWIIPIIDVGRKGRSSTGELYPMPSRIVWSTGPVLVLQRGEEVAVDWKVIGLGHDEDTSGHVLLSADNGVQITPTPNGMLPPVVDAFASKRQANRLLGGYIKQGEGARWDLLTGLEIFTKNKLNRANSIVAAELATHTSHSLPSVLDEIAIEDLLAKMLYGENGTSVITRMVDRAIDPKMFRKVDPMHYFATGVRARAEEAIRQRIGDPKIGPKIRRIVAIHKPENMEQLLATYRRIHPNDSLAAKRAIAALTAGPEISMYQKQYHDQIQNTANGGDDE